jgi:hypothetical protein
MHSAETYYNVAPLTLTLNTCIIQLYMHYMVRGVWGFWRSVLKNAVGDLIQTR